MGSILPERYLVFDFCRIWLAQLGVIYSTVRQSHTNCLSISRLTRTNYMSMLNN